jgi:hypothetical protein
VCGVIDNGRSVKIFQQVQPLLVLYRTELQFLSLSLDLNKRLRE